jgi:hypothetical protein
LSKGGGIPKKLATATTTCKKVTDFKKANGVQICGCTLKKLIQYCNFNFVLFFSAMLGNNTDHVIIWWWLRRRKKRGQGKGNIVCICSYMTI